MIAIAADVFARFVAIVASELGLRVDERARDALDNRATARGDSAAAYVDRLGAGGDARELAALAGELTVGETYFFRHREQMDAFAEVALPERMLARGPVKHLAILSAGCSSGDEAYSLAMIARERVGDPSWRVAIEAIDINPLALAHAARARYSRWALRQTTPDETRRWFTAEGNEVVLAPEIARAVTFEPRNLAADAGWPTARYDVVFCRNVLMYFTDDHAAAALERIARALVPGGFLFLGHAESLRGRSEYFELCQSHGTFYYQRKPVSARAASPPAGGAIAGSGSEIADAAAVAPASSTAWIDAIRQASDRIETIAASARRGRADTIADPAVDDAPPMSAPSDAIDPRAALASLRVLVRAERYADALAAMTAPELAELDSTEMLLLRAVVLTHLGDREGAEAACRTLIARDHEHAGAYYLLALGREGRGDLVGAAHHVRRAAELDPSFAMAYLHLGLIERRAGDRIAATRALTRAIDLLADEDPARLALFGGGFGGDALARLCRAELAAAGAKP